MRAAVIENGVVANIIEAETLDVFPGLMDATGATIGDTWDGEAFSRPAPVVAVPLSISPAQARLALLGAGLLGQVEAAVTASDLATQIAWSQATSIERDSPATVGLSAGLGLSAAQIDALFIAGASIRV